jgi:hypothetical protein
VIYALAGFGKSAISAINEIIKNSSISSEVKKHALRAVEDIEKEDNSIIEALGSLWQECDQV